MHNLIDLTYADGSTETVSSAVSVVKRFDKFGGPLQVQVHRHSDPARFWEVLRNRLCLHDVTLERNERNVMTLTKQEDR